MKVDDVNWKPGHRPPTNTTTQPPVNNRTPMDQTTVPPDRSTSVSNPFQTSSGLEGKIAEYLDQLIGQSGHSQEQKNELLQRVYRYLDTMRSGTTANIQPKMAGLPTAPSSSMIDPNTGQYTIPPDQLMKNISVAGSGYDADMRSAVNMLQNRANGSAPSIVDTQLKSASDQAVAQQLALASAQGNNPLAGRQMAQNMAGVSQNLAQQGVTGRLQEQFDASKLYSDLVSGARGQDIAVNSKNAELESSRQATNLKALLDAGLHNSDNSTKTAIENAKNKTLIDSLVYGKQSDHAMQYASDQLKSSMYNDTANRTDRQFNTDSYLKGLGLAGGSLSGVDYNGLNAMMGLHKNSIDQQNAQNGMGMSFLATILAAYLGGA